MFLVILVAMEAHEGVVRDGAYLSVTYAALIGTVAIMYRAPGTPPRPRRAVRVAAARALAAAASVFLVARRSFREPVAG